MWAGGGAVRKPLTSAAPCWTLIDARGSALVGFSLKHLDGNGHNGAEIKVDPEKKKTETLAQRAKLNEVGFN